MYGDVNEAEKGEEAVDFKNKNSIVYLFLLMLKYFEDQYRG
jgi:hypothetical protein